VLPPQLDDDREPARALSLAAKAEAAQRVAEVELAAVPTTSPEEAATVVVIGTVLWEPVLLALRRLAQEGVSPSFTTSPEPTSRRTALPWIRVGMRSVEQ
jgi:hypothetical protein